MPFELVSPLSLEACVARLQVQQRTGWGRLSLLRAPEIQVHTFPIDNDSYEFTLERAAYRESTVTATGSLERLGPSSTLVRGAVSQHEQLFFLIVLIPIIVCLLWPLTPFFLVWYLFRRYNNNLEVLDLIRVAVNAQEA